MSAEVRAKPSPTTRPLAETAGTQPAHHRHPFALTGSVTLKSAPVPGRLRLRVAGLRHPHGEQVVAERLRVLPGVGRVLPSHVTGSVAVEYDARQWSVDALVEASSRALGVPVGQPVSQPVSLFPRPRPVSSDRAVEVVATPAPGRVRLAVPGLYRSPRHAGTFEARLRRVAGVRLVQANARTGNALVEFDPARCAIADVVAACPRGVSERVTTRDHCRGNAPVGASWPRGHQAIRQDGNQRADPPPRRVRPIASPTTEPGEDWHALDVELVARRIRANLTDGLSEAEAEQRLRQYGPNRMPGLHQPSLVHLLATQLFNAPTALLGAGAIISLATGGLLEAALILAVLGTNAAVGAATERTGHRAVAALRRSASIRARVLREGRDRQLEAEELVPGDIIQLLPGDPVPADARVTRAVRLQVEESALTGESRAVQKVVEIQDARAPLADRRSMVYRGTTVVGGRGQAVIVATGSHTTLAELHVLAAEAQSPPTPMERDLEQLGRWLAGGAGVICTGVLGVGVLRGMPLVQSLSVAVSLGVAAIPEGLTALATSVLALASGRLRKKGTLIRTLGAAEALGAVTVVCADKTGTLTENRMAASEIVVGGSRVRIGGAALGARGSFERDGQPLTPASEALLRRALRVGVLCSDAELQPAPGETFVIDGSATEGALQIAAAKAGLVPAEMRAACPRLDARDRADGRRHMVTVHYLADGRLLAVMKGSPEEVVSLCDTLANEDGAVPIVGTGTRVETVMRANADMAGRAMRVLALAERELPSGYTPDDLTRGFTFLGLIGLVDPIRLSARGAVATLHGAGIRTVMITGDQAITAIAVARELGLARGDQLRVLEAGDLSVLGDEALRGLVQDVHVFARVPPEMKLEIVRALQANGDVVAMTGDGVNDGPALRAADVGVAMGQHGTELARELADVVLSTDDFGRMVDAVEEGRLVRANVRRVLHYMLATNASEVWLVAGAVAAGLPSPLSPLQLLWLNLVTDLAPALGLAVEPRDPDLLLHPPRDPREAVIPRPLLRRLGIESSLIAAGAAVAYWLGIVRHGRGPTAQSMAFASLMGAQLMHVPLARAGDGAPISRPPNYPLMVNMGLSAALQAVALFVPPVRVALGGAALGLTDIVLAALCAGTPIAAMVAGRRAPANLVSAGA